MITDNYNLYTYHLKVIINEKNINEKNKFSITLYFVVITKNYQVMLGP